MADLNYLNPTSLKPEIGWAPKNALAGMMYHQNEQDYRQVLGQQMRLQDLGEQERRYKFEELQSGRPLRDLERNLKSTQVGAQIPLAGDVVRSEQQTKLAGDKFKRDSEFSPEALKASITKYLGEADDVKYKKFMQENQYAASLLEQAISIEKMRGPVAAMDYVDQRAKELEAQGFKFPEHFKNPMNWAPMYDAALNSIKIGQELKRIKAKGDEDVRAREVSGDYGLQQAQLYADSRQRTGAGTKPPNLNNPVAALNFLEQQLAQARESGNTEEITKFAPQYEAALGRAYDANIRQMIAMGVLSNPMDEKVQAGRQKYIDNGMRLQGFQQRANPDGTPAPGQSLKNFTPKPERKPLGSFD